MDNGTFDVEVLELMILFCVCVVQDEIIRVLSEFDCLFDTLFNNKILFVQPTDYPSNLEKLDWLVGRLSNETDLIRSVDSWHVKFKVGYSLKFKQKL